MEEDEKNWLLFEEEYGLDLEAYIKKKNPGLGRATIIFHHDMRAFGGKFPVPEVGGSFPVLRGWSLPKVQQLLYLLPDRANGAWENEWFHIFGRVYGWNIHDMRELAVRVVWHKKFSCFRWQYDQRAIRMAIQEEELGISPLSGTTSLEHMSKEKIDFAADLSRQFEDEDFDDPLTLTPSRSTDQDRIDEEADKKPPAKETDDIESIYSSAASSPASMRSPLVKKQRIGTPEKKTNPQGITSNNDSPSSSSTGSDDPATKPQD